MTAAMPLRVVEGASKFIEGASLYKTFTTALSGEGAPPLVAGATTFPRKRGHYKAPLCCELLMKGLLFRALFCPLNRGQFGATRIGGGERSEPVSRIPIITYDTER